MNVMNSSIARFGTDTLSTLRQNSFGSRELADLRTIWLKVDVTSHKNDAMGSNAIALGDVMKKNGLMSLYFPSLSFLTLP